MLTCSLAYDLIIFCLTCREIEREKVAADEAAKAPAVSKDYSLKQGEKIKIKINTTRKSKDTGDDVSSDSDFGGSPSGGSKSSSSNGGTQYVFLGWLDSLSLQR